MVRPQKTMKGSYEDLCCSKLCVYNRGSLEMEVVSAVTKGLNIAGKLNTVKLLLLTIYVPCPVLTRTNVAIGMQLQAHTCWRSW